MKLAAHTFLKALAVDYKLTEIEKSLTPFEWLNIPPFAVLTGVNGCGKSQLLNSMRAGADNGSGMTLSLGKPRGVPTKTIALDSRFNSLKIETNEFQEVKIRDANKKAWNDFQAFRMTSNSDHAAIIGFAKARLNKDPREVTEKEFIEDLLPYWSENPTKDFFATRVARRFRRYDMAYVQQLRLGKRPEEIEQEKGPKPWAWFNELLANVGLPFRVEDPETAGQLPFEFNLIHQNGNHRITLNDLSAGERALTTLCCWLFNSQDGGTAPELLLLDEPDAHLHPRVVADLVNVLKNVLVEQYGMRVVMTTHRPTTIQFVPEESLFEMVRDPELRIIPGTKRSAIATLTSGFVSVLPATKMVLVEDTDDVAFYQKVFELLDYKRELTPGIPVTFVRAGNYKTGDTNKSGGRSVVLQTIKKLHDGPLESFLFGLIDLDNDPITEKGIFQHDRYCIENYLWDPVVIYHCLSRQQRAPQIDGEVIPAQFLRDAGAKKLQRVADVIIKSCEDALGLVDQTRIDVHFCTGVTLSYPQWLLTENSKKLLAEKIGTAFGGNSRMNPTTLKESFSQLAMIPTLLRDLMRNIQDVQPV